MKTINLLFFLFFSSFCLAQNLTIEVPKQHFFIDNENELILARIDNIENYNDLSQFDVRLQLDTTAFVFNEKPQALTYNNVFSVSDGATNQYKLYFTELPIISIDASEPIVSEPKRLATMVYVDQDQLIESYIGIELRGGSSQAYPKKTYDLEFWEDETGEDTDDYELGSLREDDDWILDALYNEPLRIRSHVAHKLWLEMHTLYYQDQEDKAKAGADVNYVEVFLNGRYNGLYNLSEQVDRKQLKLKKFNGEIRGELYKGTYWGGANTFTDLPDYDNNKKQWGGYEIKYPDDEDTMQWALVYDFTDFVMNASDQDFKDSIWTKFDYENYLDYFLFLNLIRANDNVGKNIYLASYKADDPYYYVPWDLDGNFGTDWEGLNDGWAKGILSNGFHKRVINLNFNDYQITVANKWFDYRDNILSEEKLKSTFEDLYNYLNDHKIYERESLVYPNYSFGQEDLDFLTDWLSRRIDFLDDYFDQLLSLDQPSDQPTTTIIYPNPVENQLFLKNLENNNGKVYQIYDTLGRELMSGMIQGDAILVSELLSGTYFLLIDGAAYRFLVK